MVDLAPFVVHPETTFRALLNCVDRNAKGIALVLDGGGRLLATVTDGDIRRAILDGIKLESTVDDLLKSRSRQGSTKPTTALVGTSEADVLRLMSRQGLRHIPLVDTEGRVQDLVVLSDIRVERELPVTCVIMAGGTGLRLRPLTETTPKPMLTVGDKPLLEKTILHLRRAGVRRLVIAVNYLAEKIIDHFGDGKSLGVEIQYVKEASPLGTAGALSLVHPSTPLLLVINGDVLTNLNIESLVDFHRDQGAELTLGVRQYDVGIPFGVVQMNGTDVKSITEKPRVRHFVNGGIYLLNAGLKNHLVPGQACLMTDFINDLISKNKKIIAFPIQEYWMDIGERENYYKAQNDVNFGEHP